MPQKIRRENPAQVSVIGLGSDYNRIMALRQKWVDAVMAAIPYDYLVEKEGFRRLVFVKDVVDLPLSGLAAHDDRIRERPAEMRNVISECATPDAHRVHDAPRLGRRTRPVEPKSALLFSC